MTHLLIMIKELFKKEVFVTLFLKYLLKNMLFLTSIFMQIVIEILYYSKKAHSFTIKKKSIICPRI